MSSAGNWRWELFDSLVKTLAECFMMNNCDRVLSVTLHDILTISFVMAIRDENCLIP